ncbi:FAD-dependent oxidoreductase [Stenotrophomonas sp. BIGb0135]|uniref:NAD(P)/FAD-dependent oxidoreductase n=1 Tax=Stenotrophomonas sp. BIGb0135 TaxID=2940620 RepID=UPI002168AC7A|nr:FAD-dependent oxidoreductase [Stenotrophomonas sp. BIGb0135]
MDLKSGYPFWAIRNGLMHAFPPLQQDLHCEVLVVGGGISGALIANELCAHGHDVAVIEQRDVGWGSTAASTALLQYEIDTHMIDLARQYGENAAVMAYQACADAIPALRAVAGAFSGVDCQRMQSLYYASKRGHHAVLHEEFLLRQRHGFDVRWLEADEVQDAFGIRAPGAILSALAARVDPYRLAYRLLMRLQKRGCGVYDRTVLDTLTPTSRGVTARTPEGVQIHCRHVVMAAGYASQRWLKPSVARNRSSYAFITDPIDPDQLGPLAQTMLWESARPYLYLRATGDHRLLVGGEDDAIDIPARRDRRVQAKAGTLLKQVAKLFPHLPLQPAFSWAGTFAETKDGLPFFGAHPQWGPRVLFAMAYGGNGITYSMIGAGVLRAQIERRRHPLAALFGFGRLE